MVIILGAGLLVFWLGYSTTQAAQAQTAADAAALAGEKELVSELESPQRGVGGEYLPASFSRTAVCGQAASYAAANGSHIVTCVPISSSASTVGWDVEVQVQGNSTQGKGSPAAGRSATASARASADPLSQASPAITTQTVTTPCEASLGTGSGFIPHGGPYGFFPSAGTNYSFGCEGRVAGALDQLAIAQHLHLAGVSGYVASGTS